MNNKPRNISDIFRSKILIIVLLLILLFSTTLSTVGATSQSFQDNTFYVDNDWKKEGDEPENLKYRENAFRSIENAINNADPSENNKIIVNPGIYDNNFENFPITVDVKNLTIIAENGPDETIVKVNDYSKNSFELLKDDTTIGGFAVFNSNYGFKVSSTNNLLENNLSENNDYGFQIADSSYNTLENNVTKNNNYKGFRLQSSLNNRLDNNRARLNGHSGFYLEDSSKNIIENNILDNNDKFGFNIIGSDKNRLTNNITKNHSGNPGFRIIDSSEDNLVNNLAENNQQGFYIERSSKNILENNEARANTEKGYHLFNNSDSNELNNNLARKTNFGFYLDSSSKNILNHNSAENNSKQGFYLESSSNHNIIENNLAENNENTGYFIKNSSNNSLENNISENNIFGYEIKNTSTNNVLENNKSLKNRQGFYLHTNSENSILRNNEATKNDTYGFILENTTLNNLDNNLAEKNSSEGFYLYKTSNNELSNNVSENNDGYEFFIENSTHNILGNNTARYNTQYGFYILNSDNNDFENNLAENNENIGYLIKNSSNHYLENNISENNLFGYELSDFSENNILENNKALKNEQGFYVHKNSENNSLRNNEAVNNDNFGFYLDSTLLNDLVKNLAKNNISGFYLENSNKNILDNNKCLKNSSGGILLDNSSKNTLKWNTTSNNVKGFVLDNSSENNTVRNNQVENENHGIFIQNSPYNTVIGNNSENTEIGIYLEDCSNDNLENNKIVKSETGIYLKFSSNNKLENNLLSGDNIGVLLDNSIFNHILNNKAKNNENIGFIFENDSENNEIKNNFTENNQIGYSLIKNSDNNIFENNIAQNENFGLYIDNSKLNTIMNSLFENNDNIGIKILNSENNLIYRNKIVNNENQAYDNENNDWDNGSVGNCWSDYKGNDTDDDNIGETAYDNIPDNGNKDHYPLIGVCNTKPSLKSPKDGKLENENKPLLEWSEVGDYLSPPVTYEIQISLKPDFKQIHYKNDGISDENHRPKPLEDDNYYWRVRARNEAGRKSDWSENLSFTVDNTPPPAPELGLPENNKADNIHEQTFTWENLDPQDNSKPVIYHIKIDNNQDFTTPENENQWQTDNTYTTTLKDNTWYWKVRAKDNAGNRGPWSKTRTLTIDNQPPKPPTLTTPENNTNDNQHTQTFKWENLDPTENTTPVTYHIKIDNNQDFTTPENENQWQTDNTYTTTLKDNTWYWKVRAKDNAGNRGPWSKTRTLTIDNQPPKPPTLTTPENNTNDNQHTQTFKWENLDPTENTTPMTYWLQVSTDTLFENIVKENIWIIEDSSELDLENDNVYYWRVKARDNAGNRGSWSDNYRFRVDTVKPPTPNLTTPQKDVTGTETLQTYGWENLDSKENSTPVSYRMQISTDNAFENIVHDNSKILDNLYDVDVENNDNYYWRVRGKDNAGNIGDWSENYKLTIMEPPIKPSLKSPDDGSLLNTSSPTLEWYTISNVDNYRVLVDDNPDFENPQENELVSGEKNNYTPNLNDGTHHWMIIAINNAGENESENRSLTIDTQPPDISNVSASTNETSATISWDTNEDSTSEVYYGTSDDYGSSETGGALTSNHEIVISGLSSGTTYHYQVKSEDEAGNLASSIDHTFTTDESEETTESEETEPEEPANDPPVANSNGPYSVEENSNVTLNGTGSSDPDDDNLSYSWTVVNDPTGEVMLTDDNTATPVFHAPMVENDVEVVVELTVTDGQGGSDSENAVITVQNISPPANFEFSDLSVSPKNVRAGNLVTVSVLVSNTGEGGDNYEVELSVNGEIENSRVMNLEGGESETVSFIVSRDELGVYSVSVENLTGSFTVFQTEKEPSIVFDDFYLEAGESKTLQFENFTMNSLRITSSKTIENGEITIREPENIPENTPSPSQELYKYVEIVTKNIEENDIENVEFRFRVSKTWISKNGIDKNSINLQRFNLEKQEWSSLSTEKIGEGENYIYFEASHSKLSLYSITGTKPDRTFLYTILTILIGLLVILIILRIRFEFWKTEKKDGL